MFYIVKDLNNKEVLVADSVTKIINFFKENYNYKLPNYLREGLKNGTNIRFDINDKNFYVSIEGLEDD